MRRAGFVMALLLLAPPAAGAEARDPRADAIDRLMPGQSIRVHTPAGATEGRFVTNRSDSLLLHGTAERMELSYSDVRRIDVRGTSRTAGTIAGMIVGGLAGVALSANANDSLPTAGGIVVGGFFGNLIGGAIHRWHRVYETPAAADTASLRH